MNETKTVGDITKRHIQVRALNTGEVNICVKGNDYSPSQFLGNTITSNEARRLAALLTDAAAEAERKPSSREERIRAVLNQDERPYGPRMRQIRAILDGPEYA